MTSRDWQIDRGGDLALRLLSAALLIPFGLFVVWKGELYLLAGCALFAALMAYEWVRMSVSPSMTFFVTLAIIPFFVAMLVGNLFGLLALVVCAISASLLHPLGTARVIQGFGLFYVSGMALALFMLRSGAWDGAAAALIFMGIVWGSDAAAYFSGRGFGGPPLHPGSPSKTWSGAVGAVIFSTLCGLLAARITGGDQIVWLVTGFAISVFAQFGDLFESSIKRYFGVKDASGLLPGHGGIMDRVDGLGFVCVFAVLMLTLMPGYAEMLGLVS